MHALWRQNPVFLINPNLLKKNITHTIFLNTRTNGNLQKAWMHRTALFHFRPSHLELLEGYARHSQTSAGLPVHVVRLEAVQSEWPKVIRTLCQEFSFCKPLTKFPILNTQRRSTWQPSWGKSAQQLIREMFSEDFRAFGYKDNPLDPTPFPLRGVASSLLVVRLYTNGSLARVAEQ